MYEDLYQALLELTKKQHGITIIRESREENISYETLYKNAQVICNLLKNKGVKKGDEIIIQCKDLRNFLNSFWACIIGGFIAVPIDTKSDEYSENLNDKIFKRLNNPFSLYDNEKNYNRKNSTLKKKSINLQEVNYNLDTVVINENYAEHDDIVYVQFSSGSTGEPNGVTLRKSNIIANVKEIVNRMQMNEEDTFLSWQPLTHCYGLIVYHIIPIMLGVSQILIPTETYIKRPLMWLEKADKYRITRLGSIPFALNHFMDVYTKSENKFKWDLSCIKSITIGAEQVTEDICYRFLDMMKKYKLNQNVIKPLYGLSESTTVVALLGLEDEIEITSIQRDEIEIGKRISHISQEDKKIRFVCSGKPLENTNVKINDDEDNELPDYSIGHIFIKGDNVTTGYYNNEEANKKLFSNDGWLNTGDIGYKFDGKLVVIGREKEIVVVNGKKYTCIDIENIIERKINYSWIKKFVVCNCLDKEKKSEQAVVFIEMESALDSDTIRKIIDVSNKIKEIIFETVGFVVENIIPIKQIPRTYSGKIRRNELSKRFNSNEFSEEIKIINNFKEKVDKVFMNVNEELSKREICSIVVNTIEQMFHIKIRDFDLAFNSYGIVSINIPPFIEEINKIFDININISSFFNNPNINKFSEYILLKKQEKIGKDMEKMYKNDKENRDGIAIVGMSCRFPGGADGIEEYWDTLMKGRDGIVDVPESRWELEKYYDADENAPGKMYARKGGFLDIPVDKFDARFFNISPKEAAQLDPQQRLLLEMTWEAFENGDIDITKYNGTNTGVYLGMSTTEYSLANLYSGDLNNIDAYSLTGTCMSTACGRIAYTFGFQGPCIAVDTACSSALTALHLACTAINAGQMSVGVVGGISLMLSPSPNIGFSKLHATSPDGHSKSFDASANGYGRGEGCGVLIIKKLSDAIRDKDNILGVIRGSGINQDGKSNGLTAPNGAAQAKLIEDTLKGANLKPLDIDYIEMHGTGTKLGDPIEVEAIVNTYGQGRSMDDPLKIGSVKSNIGHLEAAAGIASIIKVLLSMKNNLIPANLHFNNPNPFINWSESPVKVIAEHTEWKREGDLRRAGINGFGFGGSNAHIIIEEYKDEECVENEEIKDGIDYILKISAKSQKALDTLAQKYLEKAKECAESDFEDLIYSANRGRVDFDYRLAVVGKNKEEIVNRLNDYVNGLDSLGIFSIKGEKNIFRKDRKTVFMFTGQGSQYVNMGKVLFETNDVFKDALLKCDKLFKPLILKSIVDLLYGTDTSEELVGKTIYAQPLIFAIEYALFKLWESYGVKPEIVMGHSIGEYAAAVASEIMTLEDAVKLVSIRGRLMDSAPGSGAMGTIFLSEEEVEEMIKDYKDTVSIAAHNAQDSCVISGNSSDVEEILSKAEANGIRIRRLKVSHGFHSQLMSPVIGDFKEIAQEIKFNAPKVRFVSALYAKEIDENKILDAEYWSTHIREKVDFYKAVTSIENPDEYVFLELGSHRILSALCKLIFGDEKVIAGTLNRKKADSEELASSIAELYVSGVNVSWNDINFKGKTTWHRVSLPNYPFERERYWMDLLYDRQGGNIDDSECDRFIGQKIESPFMENSVVFQSKFTGENPYFMRDHIIFNTPISPAAAHISMMLSAIKNTENPQSCTLKEIEFRAPLAINGDEERQVQVCLDKKDKKKFTIVSRDKENSASKWLTHSIGEFDYSNEYYQSGESLNIDKLNSIEFTQDPEKGVYNAMRNSGFDLGDSFRRIKKVTVGKNECTCYISPLKSVPNLDMYVLYPGVIDSIIQSGINAVLDDLYDTYSDNDKGEIKTTIPYYMEKLTYNYRPSNNLWCHTLAEVKDDILYAQVTVFNESGEDIMKIDNCMVKITNKQSLLREMKTNYTNMYYHTDWVKENIKELDNNKLSERQYVVVADEEKFGIELSEKINAKLVLKGTEFKKEDDSLYCINISNKNDWYKLLEEVASDNKKYKFIYLNASKNNNINENKDIENIDLESLKGLLYLTQAINDKELNKDIKVKIVTNNVQKIGKEKQLNMSQAPLWGYSKSFALEFPEVFEGIVDIDQSCIESGIDNLVSELVNDETEEVCLRSNDQKYVNRVIKHSEYIKKGYKKADKIVIKEDGEYLITGGTGALGMVYAQQLIDEGAKNIILMCRKEPKAEVAEKIDELRTQGVNIQLAFADVCNKESLENALSSYKNIRGIIHAAGALKDKMLADQTVEEFEVVINPKVYGTVNLYNALDKGNLDFFMMLSSITSVLGNMGQSNYASANYFMNCLALQMEVINLPGFTFCWGPWKEGGMALTNSTTSKNMDNFGIAYFETEIAKNIIREFFEQPYANLMIIDVEWGKYSESLPVERKILSKVLEGTSVNKTMDSDKNNKEIAEELHLLAKEDRKEFLIEKLQSVCGKIMGFDNGKLQADASFKEQGADSLMIFSMRTAINKLLDTDINVSAFFNYPTLVKLVDYLVDEVIFADEEVLVEAESTTEDLLSELESLTD